MTIDNYRIDKPRAIKIRITSYKNKINHDLYAIHRIKYKPICSMPHKFNKIKLRNQYKNRQIGIVRKSFEPLNDKPKVSAIQNINAKIMTVQITMEEFSRL